MFKKLKRYSVDGLDSEVYAISVVEYPAIESDFIALEKQKKPVMFETDEKRMLFGAVLIPDLPIYRYDEISDFEYEIVFSRQAIEQLSQRYMRQLNAANWTTDHLAEAQGLFTAESWIKTDMNNDKSIALGLPTDLPVGTWFVGCKVDNDECWQRVKRGDFGGFSIESFISLDEMNFASTKVKNNNDIDMDKKETFFEKLKNIFAEVFETEQAEPAVEQVEAELEEETKEEEIVEQAVEEPVEANLEEEPADETAEEEVETVSGEELEAKANLEEEAVQDNSQIDELSAKIADLEAKIAGLIEKNAELQKANEKLAAQPSAKPINAKSEKNTGDVMDIIRSLHDGTFNQK